MLNPSYAGFMIILLRIPRFMLNGSSEALVQKTIVLDELPCKGKKVLELSVDALRKLSLYAYRIPYEIKLDDLIEVLALIHKRQHLEVEEIPRNAK